MNRDTRDRFASATQSDPTHGNAAWETPPAVFQQMANDFGPFDIDLAANHANHLLPLWFGPGSILSTDALRVSWSDFGRNGYINSPYGQTVPKMLAKAAEEQRAGFTTTMLLPMRVTKAFRLHVLQRASELLFCDKRITFYEDGHPRWNAKKLAAGMYVPDPALFDSIIVRFVPEQHTLKVGTWHVPAHAPKPRRIEVGEHQHA